MPTRKPDVIDDERTPERMRAEEAAARARAEKLEQIMRRAHQTYGGAFQRLAK